MIAEKIQYTVEAYKEKRRDAAFVEAAIFVAAFLGFFVGHFFTIIALMTPLGG